MCDCGGYSVTEPLNPRRGAKEVSQIDNKWILDNLNRKLLVQGPIYDIYNDIIGYITKNEDGNTVRIFTHNIKQILD
jgi:hypothetical protein